MCAAYKALISLLERARAFSLGACSVQAFVFLSVQLVVHSLLLLGHIKIYDAHVSCLLTVC